MIRRKYFRKIFKDTVIRRASSSRGSRWGLEMTDDEKTPMGVAAGSAEKK